MSLIKDYFDKTKYYTEEYGIKTIILMQVGAFFEVYGLKKDNNMIYGSAILHFSRICDLNVVDKKVCVGDNSVVMAGFKDMFLEKYIKKLQETGYTSVVFTQDEQAPNTTRSLFGIFSPGTFFSCDSEIINNNSCCIWIQQIDMNNILKKNTGINVSGKKMVYVGTSIIDIYTGKSFIFEFKELYLNSPTTFDELERIISIYNPSETILIGNIGKKEMDDIISFTNIRSNSIHCVHLLDINIQNKNIIRAFNCEKQNYQKQILEKFFVISDFNVFAQPFYENIIATQSFCYLLDFIYQHNPHLVNKIKEPIFENIGDKLILANHSLKQLNIIDDNYKGKYSSVLNLLNKCITPMGKRKFAHCLLNPTTNIEFLKTEYNIIEHCIAKNNLYDSLKTHLYNISDMNKIHRQIIIQKITPKNLYQLYTTLQSVKHIYDLLKSDDIIFVYLKTKIIEIEHVLNYTEELLLFLDRNIHVYKCKDIDTIQKIDIQFIKSGVSSDLDDKIEQLNDSEDKLECCRNYFDNLLQKYENKKGKSKKGQADLLEKTNEYVKIHETEKNNYSLVATDRRCKIIEELISNNNNKIILSYKSLSTQQERFFELDTNKNIIEFLKQSSSNKFISSYQITDICKTVSTIKSSLIDVISKVYLQIICKMGEYQKQFDVISEFITYIDLIFMKAFISEKYGYCKPEIIETTSKSFVDVTDLRHCLIEHLQQSELYVANDIILGTNDINGVLLYGTNAVGKTSFIRALGISVIMAQSGLYVPASSFKFNPFKYIFTRILGNDNIFKGLSTFAVEMSELRTILKLADKNSLVLGDELCSGTESISAISIFVAGIQKLYNVGASFIFATHLHEIVPYEEITGLVGLHIKHMTVVYDKEKDILVYNRKFQDGPGENMYGLEVCKSLSLPPEFLEAANNIRMKYNLKASSILDFKSSKYNVKHIKGICENCGIELSSEVHHLQHQQDANDKGIIKTKSLHFHKNHSANLLSLCKKCHELFHETNIQHKKVKTTNGMIIQSL
jgi:DNA mismatch repair protein MutS